MIKIIHSSILCVGKPTKSARGQIIIAPTVHLLHDLIWLLAYDLLFPLAWSVIYSELVTNASVCVSECEGKLRPNRTVMRSGFFGVSENGRRS